MAMAYAAALQAAQNGTQVYYAPQSVYDYIERKSTTLPGAPFTHSTVNAIPHGAIDKLNTSMKAPDFAAQYTVSVNGEMLPLVRLFGNLTLFKAALKGALEARRDGAAQIAAYDDAYAASVDEIGYPVMVVSPTALDFGASETSLTFDINNTGDGKLHWAATASNGKVTLSETSGALNFGAVTITVTVDRSGVPVGSYELPIAVASDGGSQEVTVSVTVS